VYVNGEVNNPGLRKFVPGKRLRYYIDATGGYTPDSDKWNVFVQLPSGDSYKITPLTLVSPKILDGSIITVGRVPEEEPLDRTEFAKEVASILADLAQVVVMVLLVQQ
jgi:protein involved in polysaccharide export with SLBB domain